MKQLFCRFFNYGWVILLLFSSLLVYADPMQVDAAFQLSTSIKEDQVVAVHFNIAPDHYLYQNKFKFKVIKPREISFGQILMPKGETKEDPFFGKQMVYAKSVDISLPVLNIENNLLTLEVGYQGCSVKGYCYPPTQKRLEVNFKNQTVKIESDYVGESNVALAWLERLPLWLIPFGFIGLGLLLSLTPCAFPMIPILSSIILGYREHLTTRKAFFLSLTYVLSMALVYAVIGAFVGFLGSTFQVAFQKKWVIISFSILFVLLAFCSFAGFYRLKLPAFLEKSALKLSHRQKAGTYLGVAIMGVLSTLIVSPCMTAPLIGTISYISRTGDALLGSVALFFMGLGMGIPLLIIGTLEGKWLPKTGNWTRIIEIILGILLLGIAIELIRKILPENFILSLWGALLLVISRYVAVFNNKETQWKTLRQGLGLAVMIYGIALIVGGLMGNESFFSPLKINGQHGKLNDSSQVSFKVASSLSQAKEVLDEARKTHKPVMVDFYATWCAYCKMMDKNLFRDSEVIEKTKDFLCLKVDVTKANQDSKELLQYFNIITAPAILFFNKEGQELTNMRLLGEVKKEDLLRYLSEVK